MALTKVQSAMIGGGSGQGFAPGVPIYENTQTVTTSYTITAGSNALSAGPITIDTSATVTVPTGSTWVIV
jgi:hypothetical protein